MELKAVQEKESLGSSGQPGYHMPDGERRGGPMAAPIDDTVFISHEPTLAIFQSALTQYFETTGKVTTVATEDFGRRSGNSFVPVSQRRLDGWAPLDRDADGRRIFDPYSVTDPGWVSSLFAMGIRWFRGRHEFNKIPATPLNIGDRARLILVGDWGTGIDRAINVSKQMRKVIDEGIANGLEQHVIHLGDVYYSGWKSEYDENFLNHWPVNKGEQNTRLTSWSLNGNHDMYSGGGPYFDYLLKDPRFALHNQSSYFSFHNNSWDILGLDTAYEDEGLQDPQVAWVANTLRPGKKSMLLSHHQLFSAYEEPSKVLKKKLGPFVEQHGIDAWFWGHEHRCVFYGPFQGVRNARLVGNGGVPVYMWHGETDGFPDPAKTPFPAPALYEYRKYIPDGLEHWAYLGFAVVDLDNAHATIRYIDEFGAEFKREELV